MIKTVYAVPTLSGGTTTTASVNTLHYCMIKGALCPLATQEGYCKITACVFEWQDLAKKQEEIGTADYISKTDLLLKLAELPQDASKREILAVVYDMPTRRV